MDFAFIDADKGGYREYYELCLELVRPGGMVALDNTLFRGHVVKDYCQDDTVRGLQEVNRVLRADKRLETVLVLCVGDGYTVAVKK